MKPPTYLLRFSPYTGQDVSMLSNSDSFAVLFTSPEAKKKMVDAMQAYQAGYAEAVGGDEVAVRKSGAKTDA